MSDDVRPLDGEALEGVWSLLDGYPHAPLSDLRGIRRDAILRMQRERLQRSVRDPTAVALGRWREGRPVGVAVLRRLAFDSDLFGFPCYSLEPFVVGSEEDARTRALLLRSGLAEVERRGATFIFARAGALENAHVVALQAEGFRFVDTTMRYAYEMAWGLPDFEPTVPLRGARPEDEGPLAEIAATYSENRFHYDARFPRDRADEMYRIWIRNSLRGDADHVVVAEVDGRPAAFTTMKDHPELPTEGGRFAGEMVFSAVSPEARGREVYTSMIHAGLAHFQGRADVVYLGCLAGNVAVQRAWQKLGFRLTSAAYGLHKWFPS